VVLGAAAAELGLGKIDRCLRLCLQVLRRADAARWRPAALVVRGAATLLSDEGSQAVEILREALRLDPDGAAPKATLRAALRVVKRRKEARDLATKRSFADAAAAYDRLLADDLAGAGAALDGFPALAVLAARSPLYARCRAERGTCRLRTGDADAALKDCAAALYVVDDLVDAHLCRANALRALGRHEEARRHLKDIIDESWGGSDVRVKHAFEQADFDLRRTKRPDYYALLNCRQVSSEREIKGAYHAQSLLHHPDRHATAPPEVQQREAEVFKRLGEALDILGDPQKRELYDKGFDKEAIHAKLEAAKRASQNHSCSGGGCGGCG
jgi:DnaJ family protein C protein 7